MCGIVGYIGNQQACPILLDGMSKLEYRGYDSAGIAVYDGKRIDIEKCVGRLQALRIKIQGHEPQGTVGIGHTRWATHGAPSDENGRRTGTPIPIVMNRGASSSSTTVSLKTIWN